ncbi:unnamed protein product [Pleuronectes platessa]|uniref:Uncharacterized protein n=1 Tax=Pleuronectes platessa TaxID=8262 RepID=A0A9N7V204_PLEPL|nr:unnamed protein product [Pleuronectes platessa]
MDNSDEPEDLLDGKIVFQKNKDRTFSKTKQYPPNHRNAKHALVGEGRSSGMRQNRLTRRTHCAKEALQQLPPLQSCFALHTHKWRKADGDNTGAEVAQEGHRHKLSAATTSILPPFSKAELR